MVQVDSGRDFGNRFPIQWVDHHRREAVCAFVGLHKSLNLDLKGNYDFS
jgi:hypothetical protein